MRQHAAEASHVLRVRQTCFRLGCCLPPALLLTRLGLLLQLLLLLLLLLLRTLAPIGTRCAAEPLPPFCLGNLQRCPLLHFAHVPALTQDWLQQGFQEALQQEEVLRSDGTGGPQKSQLTQSRHLWVGGTHTTGGWHTETWWVAHRSPSTKQSAACLQDRRTIAKAACLQDRHTSKGSMPPGSAH